MHKPPRERVTVNLSVEISDRIRNLRLGERLSASIIVEHAVRAFLGDLDDHAIAEHLRALGASRRRQAVTLQVEEAESVAV
ncbi:MAG: hypothetical protein M3Z14_02955 [Candidatus Eremiobacteraeota bacterium]|nr:hypothetical protein [Candidatus Eremiobacteraeota bacterium]